jgi:hypothetical protein
MKRRFVCGVIAAVVLCLNPMAIRTASATEYSPPWADFACSHYPGSGGLDTTAACNNAYAGTNGPYHAFNDSDVTALQMMGVNFAQSDALWAIFGHGGPGGISTYPGSGTAWTWLFGYAGDGNCSLAGSACISSYTYSQIHQIRLMMLVGCETAENLDLQNNASYDGVDISIGFKGDIGFGPFAEYWTGQFFYYTMQKGYSVANAVKAAVADTLANKGGYGGMNTYYYMGNINAGLKPAAYGS